MKTVRIGVVGGGMGSNHMKYFKDVSGMSFTAFCDKKPDVLQRFTQQYNVKGFSEYKEMIDSGLIDAILVATPHYFHPEISIYAFKKGIHVLSEKPIAVHVNEARKMIEAHKKTNLVFGVMFQERTSPEIVKTRELVHDNVIGEITRINWINTVDFRSEAYYKSGGWRATWAGEGGGVLLNQNPHKLDLLQWVTGMPKRVHGHCYLGKYHDISVEDEVTAFLEYENGATGVFIASTGEAPGTYRFEICGDLGRLVVEAGQLKFTQNRISMREYCRTTSERMKRPESWEVTVPLPKIHAGHQMITQNFINAILYGEKLIASGEEGLNSLEIGNAMIMSGIKGISVDLPLDGDAYEELLNELIEKEKKQKDKMALV